ncbi:hypothetical protein K7H13_04910 [Qipengyuania citrea]|uniref:hypothetical protein n=1 Tax=Qipengyuania citrea TaxID=225971 RepID=UPI001E3CA277|nr:hypothetical protein [Qipengyuania citrea]MCD1590101.1 hypothetical protein [Qipengyuania citrea]
MFYRSQKLRAIIVKKGLTIGVFGDEFRLAGYQGRLDCRTLNVSVQPSMGARRAPKICHTLAPKIRDPDSPRIEGCHKCKSYLVIKLPSSL